MDDKKFDELLSKSLKNGTDSASVMKDQVWNNIEHRMIEHDYKELQASKGKGMSRLNTYQRKKRKGKGLFAFITAAAILLAVLLTFNTDTGQAFISQIRQMFESEKQIIEEIEGMEEETDTQLHENETTEERAADYVIYVDEERYSVTKEGNVQRIEAKIEGDYPDVYMEITQDLDRTPEQVAKEIQQQLAGKYETVSDIEEVDDPVKGYRIAALAGQEWNSEKVVYYVTSNKLEGSFVFEQVYFFEASEGHGVRMNNMLRQFEIVGGE